ncbi:ABC transporter permease [Nocardia ignorata]|uniref:Putative ABC transport system permease protein n=1 Tax=Nocardia ignorata TaxID=145285 RepID=A0A4R6NZ22_NOCIG|nr:ABC transporter permease [Nocardia ignorata]TDP29013.1 putative ABC transport system permease protein [Nocardia ignorata]
MTVEPSVALIVLCVAMVVAAALVYRFTGIGTPFVVPKAAFRAVLQLGLIALILAAALRHLWSAALVLLVMFGAAVFTAVRRAQAGRSGIWLGSAVATGIAAVMPATLLSGAVPIHGVTLVSIGGILLGGTMTSTSLAARRGLDAIGQRWGEVEAALSLGFTDRPARKMVLTGAATDALIPGVDQARTVGLVTLPGAFIGVLLTSGSAAQAGAVQVLVLIGLMLSEACAVAVTLELVARALVRRPRP